MKILHTTLLIVALAFVNAQNKVTPLYYVNDGKTCAEAEGFGDGSRIVLLFY